MSVYAYDGSDLMLILFAVVVIGLAVWAVSKLFPVYPTPTVVTVQHNTPTKWAEDAQEKRTKMPMKNYNALKTTVFLAALTGLLVVVGNWLGGTGGMVIAFGMAMVMNGAAYWFSDRLALRMAGARAVSFTEAPELHRLVAQLAQRAGLPMPSLYIIETEAPNAFATGRDPQHGALAVTTGILLLLDRDELTGVIAHELGHIKNRDTLISVVAATVAGAITTLATMAQWSWLFGGWSNSDDSEEGSTTGVVGSLLLMILAPIAATLIQLAISRAREYGADEAGAHVAGDPRALASALRKLQLGSAQRPMAVDPATAHLYIVNPLHGSTIAGLFSTHPPIEQRIARLEQLALGQRTRTER
jgi:heat shock protein HtpX